MSLSRRLTKFLQKHKVYYQVQVHAPAMTASETAQAEHISGKKFLKAVMTKVEGGDVMVVVPSNRTLDLFKLSMALETRDVRISEDWEFRSLFPECEEGAMPPFGQLYGVPCMVDDSVKEETEVCFNAGNHEETITISGADYLRVVRAVMGDFSVLGKKVGI